MKNEFDFQFIKNIFSTTLLLFFTISTWGVYQIVLDYLRNGEMVYRNLFLLISGSMFILSVLIYGLAVITSVYFEISIINSYRFTALLKTLGLSFVGVLIHLGFVFYFRQFDIPGVFEKLLFYSLSFITVMSATIHLFTKNQVSRMVFKLLYK